MKIKVLCKTNNGSNGIRRYGFRAVSGGSLGNLIDDVTISLRPLVDIKDFQFSTIYETDSNYLRIYVNGTLNGAATVPLQPISYHQRKRKQSSAYLMCLARK